MRVVDEIPSEILMFQLENDDIYNIGQDILNKLQVNGNSKEKFNHCSKGKSSSPKAKCGRPANPTPRHKRESHIKAEYKRRDKIQKGFETLKELVPALGENSPKESKSAKLLKTVEYCRQLKADSKSRQDEASALRAELEALGSEIHKLQKDLPAAGISVVNKPCQMDKLYDDYIKTRTKQNWKFWIFSFVMKPLYDSFKRIVSTRTPTDFMQTVIEWAKDQLSLTNMRPGVFNSLRMISTQTKIMDKPEDLPHQALAVVGGESPKHFSPEFHLDRKPETQSSAILPEISSSVDLESMLNILNRNDASLVSRNESTENQNHQVTSTSSVLGNPEDFIGGIDSMMTDSLLNSLNTLCDGDVEEPMSTSSYTSFTEALRTTTQSNISIDPLPVTAVSIGSVFSTLLPSTVQSDLSLDSIFCTQTSPFVVQSNSVSDSMLCGANFQSFVINSLATSNTTNKMSAS